MEKPGNIWTGCKIQAIDGQKWVTLARVPYTPRHINVALASLGLKWAFVKWACGRETWEIGEQIAREM